MDHLLTFLPACLPLMDYQQLQFSPDPVKQAGMLYFRQQKLQEMIKNWPQKWQ